MAFAVILGFIFLLGLGGHTPNRRSYLLIGAAALVMSVWEYFA